MLRPARKNVLDVPAMADIAELEAHYLLPRGTLTFSGV